MAITERVSVIEIDFINDIVLVNNDIEADLVFPGRTTKKVKIRGELKQRFLERVVDDFWHNSKDQLDHFQYFSTGAYRCQRRKLKHDFKTNEDYWATYQFSSATAEQATALKDQALAFYESLLVVREEAINKEIAKINDEAIYFDQRYIKARRQKNELLSRSDWRILPDVEDSYEGEKDQWIAWRKAVRTNVMKKPSDFNTGLEYFKHTYDVKYPVDPKIYRQMYPGGMQEDGVTPAPAFMDPNDPKQWVKHDVAASSDFQRSREQSMYNFAGQYTPSLKKVRQAVYDIMKLLDVDDVVPVDWSLYYTDDSELDGKTG
tara:strand:- start:3451 stop:4404 length:954 start_codon:yes stop_codon:yes gene_type:complete